MEKCLLCQRQFKSAEALQRHNALSQLHKANLEAQKQKESDGVALTGGAASTASTEPMGLPKDAALEIPARRPSRFSETPPTREEREARLRAAEAEERERDRSRRSRRSRSRSRSPDRDRDRDRSRRSRRSRSRSPRRNRSSQDEDDKNAKQEQEVGWQLDNAKNLVGSVREARSINGNMDWRCGYCNHTNFARVIMCNVCNKAVDGKATYVDDSEKQRKRHENMMRLARAKGFA